MWCCCCSGNNGSKEERAQLTSGTKYGSTSNSFPSGSTDPTYSHRGADKSTKTVERKRDESSIPYLVMKPVKVPSVDKRFQDHATLFNGYIDQYEELNRVLQELSRFNEGFVDSLDAALQPATRSSDGCTRLKAADIGFSRMQKLSEKSKSVSLSKPHRHCIEIVYDGRDVPFEVIPAFLAFNSAGKLVRDLLDKAPTLSGALQLVLDNAKDLRRDILVACLAEGDRDTALRNCVDDVAMLEIAVPRVQEIEKNARDVFERLQSVTIGV
jgi:hypothetical protein